MENHPIQEKENGTSVQIQPLPQRNNKTQNRKFTEKKENKKNNENNEELTNFNENNKKKPLEFQIAESKRIQQEVPTGLSEDIIQKVKKIQEIVSQEEFHVVYARFEEFNFDENKTINYFLELQEKKQEKSETNIPPKTATSIPWSSVVKGKQHNLLENNYKEDVEKKNKKIK